MARRWSKPARARRSSSVDVDLTSVSCVASINALRKSGSVAALAVGATLARGGVGGAGVDDASPRFRSFDLLCLRIILHAASARPVVARSSSMICAGGALAGAAPGGGAAALRSVSAAAVGAAVARGIVDPSPGIGSESTRQDSEPLDKARWISTFPRPTTIYPPRSATTATTAGS